MVKKIYWLSGLGWSGEQRAERGLCKRKSKRPKRHPRTTGFWGCEVSFESSPRGLQSWSEKSTGSCHAAQIRSKKPTNTMEMITHLRFRLICGEALTMFCPILIADKKSHPKPSPKLDDHQTIGWDFCYRLIGSKSTLVIYLHTVYLTLTQQHECMVVSF